MSSTLLTFFLLGCLEHPATVSLLSIIFFLSPKPFEFCITYNQSEILECTMNQTSMPCFSNVGLYFPLLIVIFFLITQSATAFPPLINI